MPAANGGLAFGSNNVAEVTVWRLAMPADGGYTLEVDFQHTYLLPIQNAGSMDIASATSQLWVVTKDVSSGTDQVTPAVAGYERT